MTKGQRIRKRREEKNISQIELANRLGIKNQTLFKYEKDIITNIPSDTVEKIASVLECSPAYIMGWTDDENEPLFYAAFSGAGKSDPRVRYLIEALKSKAVSLENLSEKEQLLVEYYRAADERTRSIVDLALGIQDVEE